MASGDTIQRPVPCHDDEHVSPLHELQNEFRHLMSEAKSENMTIAKAFMRDLATNMQSQMNDQLNHQSDIATNATDRCTSNVNDNDAASPFGAAPLSVVSHHSRDGNQECPGANFQSDYCERQGHHFLPDINVNENDYERHGTHFENQCTYKRSKMSSITLRFLPLQGKKNGKSGIADLQK